MNSNMFKSSNSLPRVSLSLTNGNTWHFQHVHCTHRYEALIIHIQMGQSWNTYFADNMLSSNSIRFAYTWSNLSIWKPYLWANVQKWPLWNVCSFHCALYQSNKAWEDGTSTSFKSLICHLTHPIETPFDVVMHGWVNSNIINVSMCPFTVFTSIWFLRECSAFYM